jgi:cytochrome c oxidase subunit 2
MFRQSLLLLALIACLPAAALAADTNAGKGAYAPCAACHGSSGEGKPAAGAPGIAGQSQSYLVRQLWDFKKGNRSSTTDEAGDVEPCPVSMMLADGEQIANVAAYVASLPANKPVATIEGDADRGKDLYTSKCGACHGGHGWGNEALYTPRLTIIGDAYLIRQVRNFQGGLRGAHKDAQFGKQMALMAKDVSAEELKDIAAFLNEQPAAQ